MSPIRSTTLGGMILALLLASPIASAQSAADEAVPPPPTEAAPQVVVQPAPQPQEIAPPQVVTPQGQPAPQVVVQPATGYGTGTVGQPYVAQPQIGQPAYGVYGQPVPPPAPARRRGDRLTDSAQAGEIVDLMITSGGYGIFVANSAVLWSGANRGASGDDVVRHHFIASLLGATLSLSGLLAMDAPRGVPTTMAMGLRYGVLLGALGYGAFAPRFDGDAFLGAMTVGGLLGLGLGAGLGFGVRPHMSRSRFVETGMLWGTVFGGLLAGAIHEASCRSTFGCDGRQGVLGGLLAGASGAVLAHSIIAAMVPVSVARGWLMNAAFAAGAGLGAFFTWGFTGDDASPGAYMGISAATGFVAMAAVFAITDPLQDSGWEDDVEETLSRIQVGVGPTQGGAMATVGGQF